MRHEQSFWDRLIGRLVIEEHNATDHPFGGHRKDWIIIQDWRYPTKLRRWLRWLHLDRSDWERKLIREQTIKTS